MESAKRMPPFLIEVDNGIEHVVVVKNEVADKLGLLHDVLIDYSYAPPLRAQTSKD